MTNFLYKNDLPDDLEFGDSIAIDTETMGLKRGRDRLCVVQISGGDGNAHLVQIARDDYQNAKNLKKLLTNDKILKIFHFARFDLAILKLSFDIEINNVYCTKIASKIARTYTDHHGLKSLTYELLNIEISKKQQSSDWGNDSISNQQLKYAACDVLYLHKLKEKLDQILIREGRMHLANKCFAFLSDRVDLDINGFESDIFSH